MVLELDLYQFMIVKGLCDSLDKSLGNALMAQLD